MASYTNATYVRDKVTETLLQMMRKRDYQMITISELVQQAGSAVPQFIEILPIGMMWYENISKGSLRIGEVLFLLHQIRTFPIV